MGISDHGPDRERWPKHTADDVEFEVVQIEESLAGWHHSQFIMHNNSTGGREEDEAHLPK